MACFCMGPGDCYLGHQVCASNTIITEPSTEISDKFDIKAIPMILMIYELFNKSKAFIVLISVKPIAKCKC